MIKRYIIREMGDIWSDNNRIKKWVEVELAHLRASEESGIIPQGTYENVRRKLQSLKTENIIEEQKKREKIFRHDVVAFISFLEDVAGEFGRYIHYGLTSSDVIDTANALILREAILLLLKRHREVLDELSSLSKKYKKTPIMGRTHGVYAEPMSLGQKFLVYYSEGMRNLRRLELALEEISYGKMSGAVGSYSLLSPEVEERALYYLGLKPEPVSTQIVPRDRYSHVLSVLAHIGTFLERLALEIRLLHRTEVGEMREPFEERQRGSSAMPHKKNPVRCERVMGLSRLLRSYLLASLEDNVLWHERDISHSSVERVILPDSFNALYFMETEMLDILRKLVVDEERIRENIRRYGDFYYSEVLLHFLIKKGKKRQDAYEMVKKASHLAMEKKISLRESIKMVEELKSTLSDEELEEIFGFDFLRNVEKIFKRLEKE